MNPTIQQVALAEGTEWPLAGASVGGLRVRPTVPNTESIDATLDDYTVLKGIRAVPMSEFDAEPHSLFYAANDIRKSEALAGAIKQSGEITPLIVVVDPKGPYVLEGAHRLAALHILRVPAFPALVVEDHDVSESTTEGEVRGLRPKCEVKGKRAHKLTRALNKLPDNQRGDGPPDGGDSLGVWFSEEDKKVFVDTRDWWDGDLDVLKSVIRSAMPGYEIQVENEVNPPDGYKKVYP